MEKYITSLGFISNSDEGLLEAGLEKTASAENSDEEIAEEVKEFVSKLKSEPKYVYALINALTASEYISSNLNGDFIGEDVLKKYHKTFETAGNVYFHHVNKDPNKAIGKVIFSHFNPKMHRVEIVVKIDKDLPDAKKLLDRISLKDYIYTSMGLRTSYDVCSICNKKSKTRAEYCNHLKTQMNQILPDGRKVYAINPEAKFFDISVVRVPADPTSAFMKIFGDELSAKSYDGSAEPLAIKNLFDNLFNMAYIKEANLKQAEMTKIVSGTITPVTGDCEKVLKVQKRLSPETIEKLSHFDLNQTLSTFLGLRIVPTPEDFQKLALYSSGQKELADTLESENKVFNYQTIPKTVLYNDVLSLGNFSEKVAEALGDEIYNSCFTKEAFITKALIKTAQVAEQNPELVYSPKTEPSTLKKFFFDTEPEPKLSPVQNPIIPLGILGSLYYGYIKVFNDTSQNSFRQFMLRNPWLLPVLVGGATYATVNKQNTDLFKTAGAVDRFLISSMVSFPVSYYQAGKAQNKMNRQEPITSIEDTVRKHPALTGLAGGVLGAYASGKVSKLMNKMGELVSDLPQTHLDTLYNELIN